MRVLIACEFSGIVRDAFASRGHYAVSCDILSSERPGRHEQGDIKKFFRTCKPSSWDLMIAHPPCTYLANSGARHLYVGGKKCNGPDPERWKLMREAAEFFWWFIDSNIERVCVENPIMHKHAMEMMDGVMYDQIIQPWMFGHGETKATCLWLRNLPKLVPTDIVKGREGRVWKEPPSSERWKNRSRTYQGIADAMAEQWGKLT